MPASPHPSAGLLVSLITGVSLFFLSFFLKKVWKEAVRVHRSSVTLGMKDG